jgi:hypothetical protein
MADATDLKSVVRKGVRVRVPPSASKNDLGERRTRRRASSLAFFTPAFSSHIVQDGCTLAHMVYKDGRDS